MFNLVAAGIGAVVGGASASRLAGSVRTWDAQPQLRGGVAARGAAVGVVAGAGTSAGAELRRHITTPTLTLLRALAASPDDLAAALVAALEAHKAYWGASERRRRDWTGYLVEGPMGLLALARQKHLPCSVQSKHLLHLSS